MVDKEPYVLILGPYPPSKGGICSVIQYLINSPLKEKFNFIKFNTSSPFYGTESYMKESIYKKIKRLIKIYIQYIYVLNKYPINIVHINTSFKPYAFWRDSLFLLLTRVKRKKVLLHIHGGALSEFLEKYSSKYIKYLIKKILHLPQYIIVLSKEQKKPFEELKISKKIDIVPNMIDLKKFYNTSNFKKEFGIPEDYRIILFVSAHFYREKGVWEIMHCIPYVLKENENILFILVGSGAEEQRMKQFCFEMKYGKYVRFTGNIKEDDVIKLFLCADIFIFPTYYSEGFPMVILEAMAAGLPIISTPVRAIPDIIENGVNGYIIPAKNPVILAEKINKLLKDRRLYEKMKNNNKQKVKEYYDINVVSQIFEKIYNNLILI